MTHKKTFILPFTIKCNIISFPMFIQHPASTNWYHHQYWLQIETFAKDSIYWRSSQQPSLTLKTYLTWQITKNSTSHDRFKINSTDIYAHYKYYLSSSFTQGKCYIMINTILQFKSNKLNIIHCMNCVKLWTFSCKCLGCNKNNMAAINCSSAHVKFFFCVSQMGHIWIRI